ncbi:hypothetical protein I6E50_08220 [Roseburia hominis]|uniref:hypothetical protein n=1 Tax=Roseburia hominis TaxID=301301 RepID=UPI001F48449D|nr:hypothetical protein [Roseburia hominis]
MDETQKTDEIELTNKAKYYTINEIIEQAKDIFAFNYDKCSDDGKRIHKKIRKRLETELKKYRPHDTSPRHTTYARKDVYRLLNEDLFSYFINLSTKINESDISMADALSNEEKRKKAQRNLDAVKRRKEAKDMLLAAISDYQQVFEMSLPRDNNDENYLDDCYMQIQQSIPEKKHEIFFEYLFESLIDFDVDSYLEDAYNSPDFLTKNIEDSEALAYQRLKDNHNYYKPKVNLTDVLKSLLKE